MTVGQVRTAVEATVSLEFETWGKLQVTLASGSQQSLWSDRRDALSVG
jgi:subtilisin-like proprotein convertase family protein